VFSLEHSLPPVESIDDDGSVVAPPQSSGAAAAFHFNSIEITKRLKMKRELN
jgi:hypothetical protein